MGVAVSDTDATHLITWLNLTLPKAEKLKMKRNHRTPNREHKREITNLTGDSQSNQKHQTVFHELVVTDKSISKLVVCLYAQCA